MTKWNSGIYQIRNLINNKRYIGQTANFQKRKQIHFKDLKSKSKHTNPHLQKAYNKYGEENFVFEILEYINLTNENEFNKNKLSERENDWVKYYSPNVYNIRIVSQSNLGIKFGPRSEQSKINMSNAQKGHPVSEQAKINMSNAQKGKKRSKEAVEKIRQKLLGRKRPDSFTEESKQKMSKLNINLVIKLTKILIK